MPAFVRLIDEEQKRREEERLQQAEPQQPLALTHVPMSIYHARHTPVPWYRKVRKPTRQEQIVIWRTLTFVSLAALLLHLCPDPLAKGFMIVFGLTGLSLMLAYLWQDKEGKQRLSGSARRIK